jgi:hypothetical protein
MAMAARLATGQPEYVLPFSQFDPSGLSRHVLEALRPYYFSDDVAPEILAQASAHLCAESPRVLLDLSMRLQWQLPERGGVPLFVLGAEGDRISTPDDVRATAEHHGVEAMLVPGLAHMLMLERQWERAARELLRWLSRCRAPRGLRRGAPAQAPASPGSARSARIRHRQRLAHPVTLEVVAAARREKIELHLRSTPSRRRASPARARGR